MAHDTATLKQRSAPEIEAWLTDAIGRACAIRPDEIDRDMLFPEFGLSSIAAVEIVGDLEDWIRGRLPETLLWDYPTIAGLARYLASAVPEERPAEIP